MKVTVCCFFSHGAGTVQGDRLYLDIVKGERAGGGRTQAELVLFLADLEPLCVLIHDEAGDASVSLSIKTYLRILHLFVYY